MSRSVRVVVLWVVALGLAVVAYSAFSPRPSAEVNATMAELFQLARDGQLRSVSLEDGEVRAETVEGERRVASARSYDEAEAAGYFRAYGVSVASRASAGGRDWRVLGPLLLVIAVSAALAVFLLRRSGGGLNSIWALRRTNARLLDKPPATTFADVGGNDEAKSRLGDVVGFLREPQKWSKTGARPPRGVLLEGGPGLGKTLLARALAGEARVPLFSASGSDFVELFVGVAAARVRDLFERAQKQAPCIVFIDELDALARRRGAASASLTHQEREQALNQLLVCMDGFRPMDRVIVVAATNRSDVLDPALLRPGRFDIRLRVGPLDAAQRWRVLQIHTAAKALEPGLDLMAFAARTDGWSGAELEHLTNEAALSAVRAGRSVIIADDFAQAVEAYGARQVEFDRLDAALIEGSFQLSSPAGVVRLTAELKDRTRLEGELVWVDPLLLKLRTASGTVVVAREEIRSLTAADGTPAATLEALQRPHGEVGTA